MVPIYQFIAERLQGTEQGASVPRRNLDKIYSQRNLPGPPNVSQPRSARRFLAQRPGERAPVPRLQRGARTTQT